MITIREGTVSDAAVIAALHTANLPNGWHPLMVEEFFAQRGCFAYLAEEGSLPVGFILCWIVAGESELLSFAVDKAWRGAGVGTQLLEKALQRVRNSEAKAMFLEVDVRNTAALALYQAAGFEPMGRRKDYYHLPDGKRSDAVTMRIALGE